MPFYIGFQSFKIGFVPNKNILIFLKKMKCWETEVWRENMLMTQKQKKKKVTILTLIMHLN